MTRARDLSPVRRRREEQGMLLVELAASIGRSPALVSMIEGGFCPKVVTQTAIADALLTTRKALWPQEPADD